MKKTLGSFKIGRCKNVIDLDRPRTSGALLESFAELQWATEKMWEMCLRKK
jgi:hypothetical protein